MSNSKRNSKTATSTVAATVQPAATAAAAVAPAVAPAKLITRCTIQQKPSVPLTKLVKLSDHNARPNTLRAMLLDLLLASPTLEEAYTKACEFRGRKCFVTNIDTNFAVKRGYIRLEVPQQVAAEQAPIVKSATGTPVPAERGKVTPPAPKATVTTTVTPAAAPKHLTSKRPRKTA